MTHLHIHIYEPKKNAEEHCLGRKIKLGPSQLLISPVQKKTSLL